MNKSFPNHDAKRMPHTPRICRWMQIWMHVICGVCILSFVFPFLTRDKKNRKIQDWSKRLLRIFNIELSVNGAELLTDTPYLIASNHISWMDIHVINAFRPIRFVAKSEVASWPIFGWMAKQLGTVFIRRDSARHARQVVSQMAQVLQSESICIFPEGTSTNGESVLPFRPNLFEGAIVAQTSVFPMAIRYNDGSTGMRSEAPAFIGDMGLLESMANILDAGDLGVTLTILPPYRHALGAPIDRKMLAAHAQDLIAKTI